MLGLHKIVDDIVLSVEGNMDGAIASSVIV